MEDATIPLTEWKFVPEKEVLGSEDRIIDRNKDRIFAFDKGLPYTDIHNWSGLFMLFFFSMQIFSVSYKYSDKILTGHMLLFSGKAGITISLGQ